MGARAIGSVSNWSPRGKLLLLLLGMTGLRAWMAVSIPLLGGEAYYWLWGRFPAAGYYDHPPMVGYISRICFGWINGSPLAARSGPILLGFVSALLVYQLTLELFQNSRTAWRAAALFSLVPIFDAMCVLIEPDNSLLLFSVLTWLLFWKALQRESSLGLWVLAGLAAGLALLSKLHAWALLPPLYGTLLFSPSKRRLLRQAGPWLAVLAALVVVSPNFLWNSRHDWVTYTHAWRRSGLQRP
ncbi:MAG: glycosyltransferase family 39 protein [Candidatus Sumerlaeota bacterium]|nr:glycosyltransferase family 39 protein [Candidatus Sumerlaeota bacterium]